MNELTGKFAYLCQDEIRHMVILCPPDTNKIKLMRQFENHYRKLENNPNYEISDKFTMKLIGVYELVIP